MTVEDYIRDTDRRHELAARVMVALRESPHVETVERYGSLSEGHGDRYSDIDLVVHVRDVPDRTFADMVPDLVDAVGPRLVDGWGLSTLPDTYVRTLYFRDHPLFWHVDIGCLSDRHIDGSDLKAAYHWPQIFKVWIDVVKELVRGHDSVAYLAGMMSRWADVDRVHGTPAQRLSTFLDLCVERARSRGALCEAFYARCNALRREYLA